MSDYVYESGMSTKRRRQRRTAITLLLTLLFLFGAFWWAWSYIRDGGEDASATPEPTATSTCGFADPRATTVNVYNSTGRSGLAGTAATTLREQGFTIGEVANDPLDKDLPGFIELRFGAEGQPYAEAFRDYFESRVSLTPIDRADAELDVVLGDGFTTFTEDPVGLPTC
jgi:rhodanese-related sulfurtransferase